MDEITEKGDDYEKKYILPCMKDEFKEVVICIAKMDYIMDSVKTRTVGLKILFNLWCSNNYYPHGFRYCGGKVFDQIYGRKLQYNVMINNLRYIGSRIRINSQDHYFFDNNCLLPSYIKNLPVR